MASLSALRANIGQHWYLKAQRRWKCKECGKQFSVKINTIFEDSRLPLTKWMLAFWMVANCKNGVSSWEIHRAIGVTQKSAWFMLHRIRLAMQTGSIEKFGSTGGTIEADETFVGANVMKMHKSRRAKIQNVASNTYGMNRHAIGKNDCYGSARPRSPQSSSAGHSERETCNLAGADS